MRTCVARLAAALTLAAAACAQAADLTVSAAASLGDAMRAVATQFEALHPGTTVRLNLGASGMLLQQIARGAPVDVFASADLETMDRAQAEGLIDKASRRNIAANTLVLIVPVDAPTLPKSAADLAAPAIKRIAIGVPASVPAGRYARQSLESAGLWGAIEPKVIGAQNVRQALDYVARGEVDAAFVYATDAALMPDKVKPAFTQSTTTPIVYPIAAVARSAQAALARSFVEFVAAPPAQAVLARYGFSRP